MHRVSIIIPSYNGITFLPQAIDSILGQTYKEFEIIVVDDGSTDDMREVLQPYKNKIQYIYQNNAGPIAARYNGVLHATGDLVALIDQDDLWMPDKLEKQVRFMDTYPELDLLFTDFINFNYSGFFQKHSFFTLNKIIRKIPVVSAENAGPNCKIFKAPILYDFLRGNFILQSTMLMHTELCKRMHSPNIKVDARSFYEFGLQEIHRMKLGYIDEVLTHRRFHESNITKNDLLVYNSTIKICTKALEYPWMDKRCRSYLRNTIDASYYKLGIFYLAKKNIEQARITARQYLTKCFNICSLFLLMISYILTPSMIEVLKKIKKALIRNKE